MIFATPTIDLGKTHINHILSLQKNATFDSEHRSIETLFFHEIFLEAKIGEYHIG